MSSQEYSEAYKLGKKEVLNRQSKGQKTILEVLDAILPPKGEYSEVSLGLVQIPMQQIVGTKTEGRSNAFAPNFMPNLPEGTEFADKWMRLCTSHLEEGIRDPIKAYEYMNRFYVEEGNKRVSVLKYFGAVTVLGKVIRIIPKRTEEKENKIYYEFLDFYELTKINYIWFSEVGRFPKLQKLVGKDPKEVWSEEERVEFRTVYNKFSIEFEAKGGMKLSNTVGDAFFRFIRLYGYEEVCAKSSDEIKELIAKSWEEYEIQEGKEEIDLKMNPSEEKKSLLNKLFPLNTPKQKIAFIYEKTAETSAWTYAHELGRLHLEQTFPNEVSTMYYENVTQDTAEETIADAVARGCNIIFTTTPAFVQKSVKAGIRYPNVKILNCSLHTSHRYIRNYYARMHEAKFLMGAVAGAIAEENKIGYIADYPIFGTIANINAFALGAKMINPRVKVCLEWSSLKDVNCLENLKQSGVKVISGKDMIIPKDPLRFFGLFRLEGGEPQNLAMPICHWGKFYEQLIRAIMDGIWKYDDDAQSVKAINYWWGMSADVVDVVCSNNLPIGTKRLIELLKDTIHRGEYNPFSGPLYSQQGAVQEKTERSLSPEEIVKMDWLAENVIGEIPKMEEFKETAIPVISQQGVGQ